MNKKFVFVLILLTVAAFAESGKRRPFDPYANNANQVQPSHKQEQVEDDEEDDSVSQNSLGLGDLLFGNSIQGMTNIFKQAGKFEVSNREDSEFRYVDIKAVGVDKNNLNISVKDGQITLQGQIKKVEKQGDQVVSSFTSSFMQSFPIPEGVDATNPMFDFKDDLVIIKFKKK